MVASTRAGRAFNSADETLESLETSASKLAGDVKANISHMAASVSRTAHDAIDQASHTAGQCMQDVGNDADMLAETAKHQASKLQQMVEEELRDRPVRTLAIAAAVGLVVGLMTTR